MPYLFSCDICSYFESVLDNVEQQYENGHIMLHSDHGTMTNVAEMLSAIGFIVKYNPDEKQLEVVCQ